MTAWTEEEYFAYMRKFHGKKSSAPSPAVPPADPQRNAPVSGVAKDTGHEVDKRFRVHIYHHRKRRCDVGNIDHKPVLDGITKAALWPDDKNVVEITESFHFGKTEIEETIVDVFEVIEET